jgi:hypothetical protein
MSARKIFLHEIVAAEIPSGVKKIMIIIIIIIIIIIARFESN